MSEAGPWRLFVAVPLPEPMRREATAVLERLRARCERAGWRVRFSRPENLHLTLRFLGDVATERVEPLAAALGEVAEGHAPFALSLRGLGTFGGARGPRVLWLAVDEGGRPLGELAADVERAVQRAGFPAEPRPFRAHLTLGRVRRAGDPAALAPLRSAQVSAAEVDRFALFRSHLRPDGPRYEALRDCRLGAEPERRP